MDSRGPGGPLDEKNLLANYQAAFLGFNGQQAMMAAAAAAAAAASGYQNANPNPAGPSQQTSTQQQQQQQQLNINMLNQAQYMASVLQQNDTFNLIQNSLASGIPTLDVPTIFSYLGGSGSSSNNSKSSKNNLDAKYSRLMDVIQEIGRDVRPLYTGSKPASDRLRRQINQARHLVRECLMEVDRRSQRTSNN